MKEKLARDEKYLEWIRLRPCVLTQGTHNVVAHHLTIYANRGMGLKPSDYWCVPLDSDLHQKLHAMGERSFWKSHGVHDPHALAAMNLVYYVLYEKPGQGLELLRALDAFMVAREQQ